jgi:hypothetical protein
MKVYGRCTYSHKLFKINYFFFLYKLNTMFPFPLTPIVVLFNFNCLPQSSLSFVFFSFTKQFHMLLLKRLRWEKWLIPLTNIVTFLKGLIEIVLSNDLWRNRTATITLLQMQRTMEIVFVWLLKWEMADNGFSFGFDIVVNSLAKFILQFLFYL